MPSTKRPPEREPLRLYGAPDPRRFTETRLREALESSASIHVKKESERDRLVALEELAIAVFEEPEAARAFAVNPEEYLRQSGFDQVKLDLNSREVRLAMAMGDPEVRDAARRGDVDEFLRAIMQQGFTPSVNALVGLLAVELAVYVSALAVSWVAAAYTLETVVNVHHKIAAFGTHFSKVEHHLAELRRIAELAGGPKLAAQVQTATLARVIEQYVRLHGEVQPKT